MPKLAKEPYFIHNREFYKTLFRFMLVIALQNIVNYSVNMADNIMLGAYGQVQLSAAACVNQLYFLVTHLITNAGGTFSVLAAQYWGKRDTESINRLGGVLFRFTIISSILIFIGSILFPRQLVACFTSDEAIIADGIAYLNIIKYTFIPYAISMGLMDIMRNVENVRISFIISVASLLINVVLNYLLIFGNWGFARMGIRGAAIATLIARVVEMLIAIVYVAAVDKKLRFFRSDFYKRFPALTKDFYKVGIPIIVAGMAFAIGTPVQSALLGRMSTDAIAANSVTSTFYQYIKVIALALTTAAGLLTGITIGKGKLEEVRACARTVEAVCLGMGILLAGALFLLRKPLLAQYSLTPGAMELADRLLIILCVIMLGMSYEVPILFGVIKGGGDTVFVSVMNLTFMWAFCIPMAFLALFVWHMSAEWVVIFMQADQLIKCIPAAIRIRQYDKWIHVLTRE